MEKYARQALSEGVKSYADLHVSEDSELYKVISVHYNRNNHVEVSFLAPILGLSNEVSMLLKKLRLLQNV